MRPLEIQIVSDVVCPWCFIGTRRLELALAARPNVAATLHFRPFLLDPNTPPEGQDLRERLAKKYKVDPESMFHRVEAAAAESGIALDFAKVRRSVSTVRAHTLLRHAETRGTQHSLARALFTAYFLEGRDISNTDVLVELGLPAGFSEAEVIGLTTDSAELAETQQEARSASAAGVTGVPFFIFDERLAVPGAQSVEVLLEVIDKALATATSTTPPTPEPS